MIIQKCACQKSYTSIIMTSITWAGPRSPPDELEASPAGSRSDDYVLAFLWFSAPPPPKLRTILVCCCCSSWPGLPEPPSLRSKTKQRSQCFRALPANENSPPFTRGPTSRLISCAVQELKIRRPRTDKIVTILQCLYLINGKVK